MTIISETYALEIVRQVDELEAENARLRAALTDVVKWADELGCYADQGTVLAPVFVRAKAALGNEQKPDYAQELVDQAQAFNMGYGQSPK